MAVRDPYRPDDCEQRLVKLEEEYKVRGRMPIPFDIICARFKYAFWFTVFGAFISTIVGLCTLIFGDGWSFLTVFYFTLIMPALSFVPGYFELKDLREYAEVRKHFDVMYDLRGQAGRDLELIGAGLRQLPRDRREDQRPLWDATLELVKVLTELPEHRQAREGMRQRREVVEAMVKAEADLEAAAEANKKAMRERDLTLGLESIGDADILMAKTYTEAILEGKKVFEDYTKIERELT